MSAKWFCFSEGGLNQQVKAAVYMAGFLVAKNNLALAVSALPVAKGIQAAVDGGGDNAALNAMIKEAIVELIPKVSTDPVVTAAVGAVLVPLGINVPAGTFPTMDNATIKDLIDSFVAGVTAAVGV
jgi:hypothetical protein